MAAARRATLSLTDVRRLAFEPLLRIVLVGFMYEDLRVVVDVSGSRDPGWFQIDPVVGDQIGIDVDGREDFWLPTMCRERLSGARRVGDELEGLS